jgi:hypothetical protein
MTPTWPASETLPPIETGSAGGIKDGRRWGDRQAEKRRIAMVGCQRGPMLVM